MSLRYSYRYPWISLDEIPILASWPVAPEDLHYFLSQSTAGLHFYKPATSPGMAGGMATLPWQPRARTGRRRAALKQRGLSALLTTTMRDEVSLQRSLVHCPP